jgi:Fic family protein
MKKPESPPSTDAIIREWAKDQKDKPPGERQLTWYYALEPTVAGKYLPWDKLLHHTPPEGISHREWWLAIKEHRRRLAKPVPLVDKGSNAFHYALVDPIPEALHRVDLGAGGRIQMPAEITNPETKDRYYVSSLIEEAITSSQLEGATTTRRVAKDMLRSGRPPRDRSERMILNNYLTMRRIGEVKDDPLTKDLVFELHRLVTEGTLDDPSAAGRLRRPDERIIVGDDYGEVFHDPPDAGQLEERMSAMCDFANGRTPDSFVHPAIRSIVLHFWLSYDHPFVDGNGRTARALFYWSMLHHGYWLFEFISISHIIRKAPTQYGLAFLYTETDENDLTYFILYHLDVIRRAIDELHAYLKRKAAELKSVERSLRGIQVLNHRQRDLITHALRHPGFQYTIESHRMSHNVVYETARTDLLDLQQRGLLRARKIGRTWYFTPREDLEKRLAEMG